MCVEMNSGNKKSMGLTAQLLGNWLDLWTLYTSSGIFSRKGSHWPDNKKRMVRNPCDAFSGITNWGMTLAYGKTRNEIVR